MERIAGELLYFLSTLKRQRKLPSALKLMIYMRELLVSNPGRPKSVPTKDIPLY